MLSRGVWLVSDRVFRVVTGRLDPAVRASVEQALLSDRQVEIIAAELSRAAFVRVVRREAPDLSIVDEAVGLLPLMSLKASRPAMALVVVSSQPADLYGELLMMVGVTCLARGLSSADMRAAVIHAARGEQMFVSADGRRLARRTPDRLQRLTAREREVFEQLRCSASDGEIALALRISPETVRTHTSSILRKLEVKSKRDLAGWPEPGTSDN